MRHLLTGRLGERYAARYLREQGYRLLRRNYRTAVGEIDIIARDGETLTFIEVKTRSSAVYGSPEEAVDQRKQRQLVRTAQFYLNSEGDPEVPCRFDVVAVSMGRCGFPVKISLIQDAFGAALT